MDSNQSDMGSSALNLNRRRFRLWTWLIISLLAYAGFVLICFYIETHSRTQFKVPTKADIATITDKASRIRAESAKNRALTDMRSWQPYAIYSTAVGVIVLGGTFISTVLGAVIIWRGVRRSSVRKAIYIVIGVLLVMLASLLLLAWPVLIAEKRYESTRTSFLDNI